MPRQEPIGRRQTARVVSDGPSRQPESRVLVLPLLDSSAAQSSPETQAGRVTDVPSSQSAPGKFRKRSQGSGAGQGAQTASACALKAACWERVTSLRVAAARPNSARPWDAPGQWVRAARRVGGAAARPGRV